MSPSASRRAGFAFTSIAVPAAAAASTTAATSGAMPGRLLMIRPVGWPRISTYGCSTARISRARGGVGVLSQRGVRRGDDDIEVGEGVVVGGDLSLRVDVGLDPVEHLDVGVG